MADQPITETRHYIGLTASGVGRMLVTMGPDRPGSFVLDPNEPLPMGEDPTGGAAAPLYPVSADVAALWLDDEDHDPDPELERRRAALVHAARRHITAGRAMGLPIDGTTASALAHALDALDEYAPAEVVAPASWVETASADAKAARIARYEETSCLGRDRDEVLADFPEGVDGAVRLARADVAARAPGWRTVRALLLALEEAATREPAGPADRAEIGEVLRNATDALADLVHNCDDPGTAALGALFEARQTVSRLRPDPALTRTWTAGAVDPARWLRGATSSGDPLFPAVSAVLAELDQLRAKEDV